MGSTNMAEPRSCLVGVWDGPSQTAGGVGIDPFFPEKNGETKFGESQKSFLGAKKHRGFG